MHTATRAITMIVLLMVALLPPVAQASAQPADPPSTGRSAAASQPGPNVPNPGPPEKPGRDTPKLDSKLVQLEEARRAGRLDALASKLGGRLVGDRVPVTIEATPGAVKVVEVAAAAVGGEITTRSGDFLDARIPLPALSALAKLPAVRAIEHTDRQGPSNAINSHGVSLTNAWTWHRAGYTGAGVKVAIVDGGFAGYQNLLGGELPATVDTSCSQNTPIDADPNDNHGRLVAEVVHDVAPDATLFLVNQNTDTQFDNAVNCLIAKGVHVINYSVNWYYDGPGDGTGRINEIVNKAANAGITFVNSAGNFGDRHWSGNWLDADADGWLEFSGGSETQRLTVNAGDRIELALRWADSWQAACNDYDLYLAQGTESNYVARALDWQYCTNGATGMRPKENILWIPASGGTFFVKVFRYSGTGAPRLDLVSRNHVPSTVVADGSIVQPADNRSTGFLSVGAVNQVGYTALATDSSRGPTTDGRIKPDLAAPTGVSTSSGSFVGTSAAAPHVAGAAALVKQMNPTMTGSQVADFLRGRTQDLGVAGPDNSFGRGRLQLDLRPACSFNGVWDTWFGPMWLTQTGTTVSGRYLWLRDQGRVTGTVSGNRLLGSWSELPTRTAPNDAGNVEFTMATDCRSFTGRYQYGATGAWIDGWTGARLVNGYALVRNKQSGRLLGSNPSTDVYTTTGTGERQTWHVEVHPLIDRIAFRSSETGMVLHSTQSSSNVWVDKAAGPEWEARSRLTDGHYVFGFLSDGFVLDVDGTGDPRKLAGNGTVPSQQWRLESIP